MKSIYCSIDYFLGHGRVSLRQGDRVWILADGKLKNISTNDAVTFVKDISKLVMDIQDHNKMKQGHMFPVSLAITHS